tara:strand:+ start:518 stop:691 length:174 start_codon:yes stop_codon:yes gene_type:complete
MVGDLYLYAYLFMNYLQIYPSSYKQKNLIRFDANAAYFILDEGEWVTIISFYSMIDE